MQATSIIKNDTLYYYYVCIWQGAVSIHNTIYRGMGDYMKDFGCDPVGDGTFKMVPSGDIVDVNEKNKRLPPVNMNNRIDTLIGALTANQVEGMQGGKLNKEK